MLGSMLGLPGFEFESIEEVRKRALPADLAPLLSNLTDAAIDLSVTAGEPCVALIYQLDGIVRRAGSLQLTAEARATAQAHEVTA